MYRGTLILTKAKSHFVIIDFSVHFTCNEKRRERQIKLFSFFIAIYSILTMAVAIWFCQSQTADAKSMFTEHDMAIASALLEKGISKEVIANAVSNTEISADGAKLLNLLGIGEDTVNNSLPYGNPEQTVLCDMGWTSEAVCYNAYWKGGGVPLSYKEAIIQLVGKIHNERILKRIYELVLYLCTMSETGS